MTNTTFWADDFDVDLLKVFPEVTDIVRDTADTPMWTLASEDPQRPGKMAHPATWASLGAMFWLDQPDLPRDENGYVRLQAVYLSDNPFIQTSWLEVLRDAWAHHYRINLYKYGFVADFDESYNRIFHPMMMHTRNLADDNTASMDELKAGLAEKLRVVQLMFNGILNDPSRQQGSS